MKSILDASFVYVPAVATDIAKTFARAREAMATAAAQREATKAAEAADTATVHAIIRARQKGKT